MSGTGDHRCRWEEVGTVLGVGDWSSVHRGHGMVVAVLRNGTQLKNPKENSQPCNAGDISNK